MTPLFWVPILALLFLCQSAWGDCVVVFDEVMYHPVAPDNATELQREWIELRNQMAVDIDLSGWRLAGGIDFVFPPGTLIRAGGVLVVAANPAAFQTQTGVAGALGPWSGQLSNDGETIELRNNNQRVMDELRYDTDSAWPSAPDGGGASLSKKGRNLATNDSASWRSSTGIGGTPGAENFPTSSEVITTTLIALNEPWKYHANGTNEGVAWRSNDFVDAAWNSGATTFHLGTTEFPAPATSGTPLPSGPVTYYFRRPFLFNGSPTTTTLRVRLLTDDGAAFYLNGSELLRLNLPGGTITHDTPAPNPRRGVSAFQEFDLPNAVLRAGDNVLAAELHQAANLPSYPAAVVASGPIAYWRFGESTGPLLDSADLAAAPESGAQNGMPQGFNTANVTMAGVRPGDGFIGFDAANAAPFFQGNDDGENDVFTFADAGLFNFSSNRRFTVEGWVKAASTQEDGAAIFCKGTGGGGEQFCLDVIGGRYRLFVRDGGGGAVVAQSNVSPSNLWQHVAIVYDQSAAIMRLYVNGVVAVSGTPPATLLNTTHEVSIGARKGSSAPGYTLNLKGFVDETAIYNRALTQAEISAHYAAASVANPGGIDTSDALFTAELVATETLTAASAPRFVFNEVSTGAIELMNAGGAPLDLANYTLVRTGGDNYTTTALPSQIIAPGSFASLNFVSNPGDRLVLLGNASRVADSVEVKTTPRARRPDGSGEWLVPSMPTPGAANAFQLRNEILINEIMFDHPAAALLPVGTERSGQWIELHNRSNAAVDLGGWSMVGGITFAFPAGATVAAGDYVVVAENPAGIIAVHAVAAAKVFGPWSGTLSHSHDQLILNDPTGNPADEVSFFDSGSWPEEANAGGSSLELRDPQADNRRGEAWAASDESAKAGWQTFTWRGQNSPSQPGEPTLWRELDLLLVDGPGECLVDDVRVTDLTTGTNLIQNGTFDESDAHWRLLGNHRRSRVEPEPGAAGNNVLHLIATGPGEYQGNQIESTFAGNQALVAGRQYEISLRARWLSGGARLNTRLYFNRLPRTNLLNIVANGGTPGAGNSRATPNIGPTYGALKHSPAVPAPAEPVTVEIDANDPQNVAALDLKYSIAGGAWQSAPMTASSDGHYIAVVPGQAAGTTVQFYVEGRDSSGALSVFPAHAAGSRALYRVRGSENGGALPLLRLIMTPADAAFLHAPVNTLSNEYLGATLIADGGDVYYDVGVRLKGSFVGRNTGRVGFNISFPSDRLFRGVLDKIALDRSMHTAVNNPAEIIIKHVANQAGGIPSMYDDLAYLAHPNGSYSGVSSIRLAAFEDEYLDSQFPDGSDGSMFEFEVLRWALATINGNPESPKLPGNEGSGTGYTNLELTDYGNDKEAYRWNALQTMGRDDDDYAAMIGLGKMFALSGASFLTAARQRLDVDAWLRTLAFQSLVGPADAIYTGSNIHNFRLYFRPHDGRALYMPWDWDSAFQRGTNASLIGGGNIAKVVTAAADHTRRYHNHLHDIITTTYNSAYMGRWTQHYGTLAGQNYSSYLNYIAQRAAFVLTQLPTTTAFAAAAGAVTTNGATTITGTANIAVALILVNGLGYSPTWSSNTAWSITVPLAPGSNTLILRGVDLHGNDVPGASTTLTITNPNESGWPALRLNEWLAENDGAVRDPIDNDSEDWFEIHNPTAQPVDLSGWKLSDDPAMPAAFVIPNGWSIPAGSYLLVWADNEPVQNPSPPLPGQSLHVPFKLDGDGDTLLLSAPDNRPIDQIAFGSQRTNAAEGSYPDGSDATQRLTVPSPASANVFASYTNLDLAAPTPTFTITTTPGWRYQLETSIDFLGWTPAGDPTVATSRTLLFNLPPRADPVRFFRVRISP